MAVSRRTLRRAVQPYRQGLKAEALASVRFETAPGQQLQIDFGERLVTSDRVVSYQTEPLAQPNLVPHRYTRSEAAK